MNSAAAFCAATLCLVMDARAGALLAVPEDYPTVQSGLDAASPFDTVSVAPGLYPERVSFPADNVVLRSRVRHGATLDGGGLGNVVMLDDRIGTVDGFIITGGLDAGIFTSGGHQSIVNNVITANWNYGILATSGAATRIIGNRIQGNGVVGTQAAVRATNGATVILSDNLIQGNGLGVQIQGGGEHFIVRNTIAYNDAHNCALQSCRARISDNIVVGGQYGIAFSAPYEAGLEVSAQVAQWLTIHHNDVWDNGAWDSGADYFAWLETPSGYVAEPFDPRPGDGELSVRPRFVSVTDFRLDTGSPCINTGSDSGLPPDLPATDLDGNPREVGPLDIGAYEHQSPVTAPLIAALATWDVSLAAWPNPCRNGTTLVIGLDSDEEGEIGIHDVAGRRVRRLPWRTSSTGAVSVFWDLRDDQGTPVAAGTYLARLSAGGAVQVRKVVVLDGQR